MDDPIRSLRTLVEESSTSSLNQYPDISAAYQKLLADACVLIRRFDERPRQQAQASECSPSGLTQDYNVTAKITPTGVNCVEIAGRQNATSSTELNTTTHQGLVHAVQPEIRHRMEDAIPVLLPTDKSQCRDIPSLLARAAELGASYTGVFKYVLPKDVDLDVGTVRVSSVSTFSAQSRKDGGYQITYHKKKEQMEVKRSQSSEMSPRDLAAALEKAISDPNRLGQMRYSTDCPARTPQERKDHGLPIESPLSSLKGNQLSLTAYGISGVHWPDAYAADEGGGLFVIHTEDGYLHSLNVLHFGLRSITVVIPQHAPLIDRFFKKWPCAQRARHESTYIPQSILDKLGVSYNVLLQRPREVVVFMPYAYHQGGSISPASAEAVNYAAMGWSITGYSECRRGRNECPGYPIPNAYLTFRAPEETQLEQEFDPFASNGDADKEKQSDNSSEANADAEANTDGGHGQSRDLASIEESAPMIETSILHSRKLRRAKTQPDACESVAGTFPSKDTRAVNKRCANTSAPRLPTKTRKTKSITPDQELAQVEAQIKSVDRRCKIPIYSSPEPRAHMLLKLVAAIWSRLAIKQFVDLVRSRRDSEFAKGSDCTNDIVLRIGNRMRSIQQSERRSTFEKFQIRLDQWHLAEYLEMARQGRHRNDPAIIKSVCTSLGWKKTTLDYHRVRGQAWRRLCGRYDGLLGFVLFGSNDFGISPDAYLNLQGSELDTFHTLLDSDYTRALCNVGKAFQASLDPLAWDVEFRWESLDDDVGQMSEAKLLTVFEPFPTGHEDLYNGDDPEWTRPQGWKTDWKWPCDPTSIPDLCARYCELCHDISCECIQGCFISQDRPKPRIRQYGRKGRGLQAVARRPGELAYTNGDVIGILVGKIVPEGADKDEWSMQVRRTDLPRSRGELGCSIHYHYGDFGNIFRLMNSHCDPPAAVRPTRISGKCRLVVKAIRDIRDGEEITIDYGKEYFATYGLKCLCEVCDG